MKNQRTRERGVRAVSVQGVIKLGQSPPKFSTFLSELLNEEGSSSVLLDLANIDYVDSTGLGELVGYLQRFSEKGRQLGLLNAQKRIMGLLKLTKLDEVFSVYTSREEAIGELALPDFTFEQVFMIRTKVTLQPAVGQSVSQQQVSFLFECFGDAFLVVDGSPTHPVVFQ